jgi:glycerol-1-phosphate dehydrogenase [NAD(P)+]
VAQWPEAAAEETRVRRMFVGTDFVDTAVTETRAKHVTPTELRTQLTRLKQSWPEIRSRLQQQLVPSIELKRWLELVGAPTAPEQIGITRERLRESFYRAYHIRRRFTVLDVVMRTGTLAALLDRLFGKGGVWQIQSTPTKITV